MKPMIQEHDFAVLTRDLDQHGLKAGDVGVIVNVLGQGQAYQVEFEQGVYYLEADDVRPKSGNEILHVRPLKSEAA
jgi:hypothetical protein